MSGDRSSREGLCRDLSELTVIVPVLNEAEGLPLVLRGLIETGVPRERIIVVDGGSTDGSPDIARREGVVVVYQEGRGKAAAIKTGLRYVKTRYVAVIDGDYTYPPEALPELLCEARRGSLVIGRRVPERGSMNIVYRVGNWFLTKWFNILFGTRLRDVLSGMYVVETERLREVDFEMGGFSVESEIAAHMASIYGDVREVPVRYRKRVGRKKLRPHHGLLIALAMVRLTWRYNPVFFISILGSLLLIPGLALGAYVGYHYIFEGIAYHVKGLIAVVTTLVGLLSLVIAVLALYIKRMEMRILRLIRRLEEKLSGATGRGQ